MLKLHINEAIINLRSDILTLRYLSFVKVNPNNTSQLCSCCNAYVPKDLSMRLHECECGYVADRDVNAGVNIKRVGQGVFPTIKRRKDSSVSVVCHRKSGTIS
ncbi:transposase [Scytonema tolypothrichoides VB-61278]|nr:transposase [Scytonema tolypothrichoides VB-61278]